MEGNAYDIAMGGFCLEVWSWRQLVSIRIAVRRFDISQVPMDPSLRRGCSAGIAYPRRSSGVTGRCARSTGRADERRAREAARGRNEAIV